MREFIVVLAEPDETYILPLIKKLLEKFQKNLELIVITEQAYLYDFFSRPQKMDLLIIANEWKEVSCVNHEIGTCLFLCEDKMIENEMKREHYNDINDLYQEICIRYNYFHKESQKIIPKKSKLIAIYSPIGGVGKTLIAMSLWGELEKEKRQVLYLNMDKIQSFQYFLQDNQKSNFPSHIKYFCHKEENMEKNMSEWEDTLLQIETYDWVVADLPSELMAYQSKILSIADEIVFVLQQDPYSSFKCEQFMKKMDLEKLRKCYFVCNKSMIQKENRAVLDLAKKHILLDIYIEYSDIVEYAENGKRQLEEFRKLQGVKKLIRYFLLIE